MVLAPILTAFSLDFEKNEVLLDYIYHKFFFLEPLLFYSLNLLIPFLNGDYDIFHLEEDKGFE